MKDTEENPITEWIENLFNFKEYNILNILTGIAVIYLGIQLGLTQKYMREQVYPNGVALCEGYGAKLTEINANAGGGKILITCSNARVPIYFNNYTYIRNLTEKDLFNISDYIIENNLN